MSKFCLCVFKLLVSCHVFQRRVVIALSAQMDNIKLFQKLFKIAAKGIVNGNSAKTTAHGKKNRFGSVKGAETKPLFTVPGKKLLTNRGTT